MKLHLRALAVIAAYAVVLVVIKLVLYWLGVPRATGDWVGYGVLAFCVTHLSVVITHEQREREREDQDKQEIPAGRPRRCSVRRGPAKTTGAHRPVHRRVGGPLCCWQDERRHPAGR